MLDLSLAPQGELIGELIKRNDAVIIGTLREGTTESSDLSFQYAGGLIRCLGMIESFRKDIHLAIQKNKEKSK